MVISPRLLAAGRLNWANLVVDRAWIALTFPSRPDMPLNDGLPDGWSPGLWGGEARAVHGIDREYARSGKQSAYILHSNSEPFAVFSQEMRLVAGAEIVCEVYTRGSTAFVQVQAGGRTVAHAEVPAQAEWALSELRLTAPQAGPAVLILGAGLEKGTVWFDDARCRALGGDGDLAYNGSFEADGTADDSFLWWADQLALANSELRQLEQAAQILAASRSESPARISRLNAVDLLANRPGRVVERAPLPGGGCLDAGSNPALLLAFRAEVTARAGRAGFERLARLATALMPQCPQAYVALAELYQSVHANAKAAELYDIAVQKSRPGAQRGAYAFEAGWLELTWLGNWERALASFSMAEANSGWEPAPWYYGAATLYKGWALQATGQCRAARAAYQRILDCARCLARQAEASAALDAIGECEE